MAKNAILLIFSGVLRVNSPQLIQLCSNFGQGNSPRLVHGTLKKFFTLIIVLLQKFWFKIEKNKIFQKNLAVFGVTLTLNDIPMPKFFVT